jgi:hypothetical protein
MLYLGTPEQVKQWKERGVTLSGRDEVLWRKSTYSGGGNDCVEISSVTVGTTVRDSKNPDGPQLRFGSAGWAEFVGQARSELSAH